MKPIGNYSMRFITILSILLVYTLIALPYGSGVSAAAAFVPDDFNRCSPDPAVWSIEDPTSLNEVRINGQYQGDSALTIIVPAGDEMTFSNTNQNAPRVMQNNLTDIDFELEVKFNTPLGPVPANGWTIQGILLKDTVSSPGKTRWLRFDLDANSTSINYYAGYIDENGLLHHLSGPNVISTQPGMISAVPLYLRLKYEQAANRWTLRYRLSDTGSFSSAKTFLETGAYETLPTGFTFDVSSVGVFAGSTGVNPPGYTSRVDYVKNLIDPFTDDAITLNVQTDGFGAVDWPMTNPSMQCVDNQITLTATPTNGAVFSGWSGDLTNSEETVALSMTNSFNLTATFIGGELVDLPFINFVPFVSGPQD